ncbi:Rep family protein [Demequina sp.]|uniref:Rep family protein n=1 Tax=Demequina sp. TaxID=2050685 RepID=UPI003A8442FA
MAETKRKVSGPGGKEPPAYVTFSQNLAAKYWPGWDPALITAGSARQIGEEVLRRYEAAGGDAKGLWVIKHDQDRLDDGSPKADHIHAIIQQSVGRQVDGKLQCVEIDRAIGFSTSVVRAPGRGGRIENAQSYLIHAKDPAKFQYSPRDVTMLRGEDYLKIEESHRRAWARRAVVARNAPISKREWSELGDAMVQKVLDGELDELAILDDRTLGDIYARNKTNIDLAFSFRARREMHAEVEKLRRGAFRKTVVWVMGASDQGKSFLAEGVATELQEQLGWNVFRSTAKNGPDDYAGQEIFLMNEPGSRVMEWPILLMLLDPRQAGPISARYVNKRDAAPRVILIAVSVDPVEFGFFVPGKRSTSDSLDQLVRRITLQIDAKKLNDDPHYTISRVSQVESHSRVVSIPDGGWEQLAIGYGPTDTAVHLTHSEAIETVLTHVAERSPDVALRVPAHASIEARQDARMRRELAARGITVEHPVVPVIHSPERTAS